MKVHEWVVRAIPGTARYKNNMAGEFLDEAYPGPYFRRVVKSIPRVISGQLWRAFVPELALAEMAVFLHAFRYSSLVSFLLASSVVLLLLAFRDMYTHDKERSLRLALEDSLIATNVLVLVAPAPTMYGAMFTVVTMMGLRLALRLTEERQVTNKKLAQPTELSLEALHARSIREFSTTWLMNIGFAAGFVYLAYELEVVPGMARRGGMRDFVWICSSLLTLYMALQGRGHAIKKALWNNFGWRRKCLMLMRDNLVFHKRTGRHPRRLSVAIQIVVFGSLGINLSYTVWTLLRAWLFDTATLPLNVYWYNVGLNLGLYVGLIAMWDSLKWINRYASIMIQQEIDALDRVGAR